MREKLDWARRSFARMRDAERLKHPLELQDHFWSFLHATQLIWFYFGRWTQGVNVGKAESLVQQWEASLESGDRATWKALNALRSRDVHLQPVPTHGRSDTSKITLDGVPITVDGANLVVTRIVYEVESNGARLDAFKICSDGLRLLDRFVADFDQIGSERF